MSVRLHERRWVPWAGLLAGPSGWLLQHQVGTYLVYEDCARGGPLLLGVLGLIAGTIAAGGGLLSYLAWRNTDAHMSEPYAGTHRFLGAMSAMVAALTLLLILSQTIAGFVVPPCFE